MPILSKVTRVPMVKLAVAAMLGHKLRDSEYGTGLYKKTEEYAVKGSGVLECQADRYGYRTGT